MILPPEFDDQLIDLIYAVTFGEARWEDFLTRLNEALPGGMSGLLYHDINSSAGAIDLQAGIPPEWADQYARHYARINPWMAAAAVRPVGLGVVAEQMLPRAKFIRTEFYNDGYRSLGNESAVGITIVREDGRSFLLSTMTASADANANRQAADRLTRLAPHLKRAFTHFQCGYRNKIIAEVGNSVFDAIDIGVVIVGAGSSVKSISATAEAMMASNNGLATDVLGKLRVPDRVVADALVAMLERGYAGPRVFSRMISGIKLSMIKVQKDRQSEYFEGPTIVITLENKELTPTLNETELRIQFGITTAELRTLKAIFSGQSVNDIADTEQRSRETIRGRLKSLYYKTNTSRQSDLVRLAMKWTEQ
jgi:DNA-binding CsgD family transcriptional regulator